MSIEMLLPALEWLYVSHGGMIFRGSSGLRERPLLTMKWPIELRDSVGRGAWGVPPLEMWLVLAVFVLGVLLREVSNVLVSNVLLSSLRYHDASRSSFRGTLVYWAAAEKYFGMSNASSGRIAGRHAQMMATLTSTADSVACAGLSNDRSLLLAMSWRE
jgi:hypothetical protein